MWNIVTWSLIACASAYTTGSIFVPPYHCRMRPIDSKELQRRQRMVEVLQRNVRVLSEASVSAERKEA